jgi:hypothetical protein
MEIRTGLRGGERSKVGAGGPREGLLSRKDAEAELKTLERIMLSVDAQLAVLNSDEGMLAWAARRGACALQVGATAINFGNMELSARLEGLAHRLESACVRAEKMERQRGARKNAGNNEWFETEYGGI